MVGLTIISSIAREIVPFGTTVSEKGEYGS